MHHVGHWLTFLVLFRIVSRKAQTENDDKIVCIWQPIDAMGHLSIYQSPNMKQELSSCWDRRPCQSKVGQKVGGLLCPFRGGVPSGILSIQQCLATIAMGRTLGYAVLPFWGDLGRHLTQCRLHGLPNGILIHPAVWPQETWAKNWTAVPLLGEGELSPHLTQCDVSQGLHTILISKCFVRTAPSFKNST